MKFEKFLKSVGTHGEVITLDNNEKWLVCDGVGMIIPCGVDNLLGTTKNDKYATIVHAIANLDFDDPLTLTEAVLFDPTGNAKAIYRVFETELGDRVGICNADYGLLEKNDVLGYCEIEVPKTEDENSDDVLTIKYVLDYDYAGNIQGFITGSDRF